jgi:hypothetical protein
MTRSRFPASRPPSGFGAFHLLVALVVAVVAACLDPSLTSASPTPDAAATPMRAGMSPMPNDGPIPQALLPPGSDSPDEGPSAAIFPPQRITIRFNHKWHSQTVGVQCTTCHAARDSDSAKDRLFPTPTTCDGCHGTDHSNLDAVLPGSATRGQCAFCHLGYAPSDGNHVAQVDVPRPNLNFTHKKHLGQGIKCAQCHGDVSQLELATRDQLPRMAGCFGCHQSSDASRHAAKSACTTCHLRELGEGEHVAAETLQSTGGRMRTVFATGVLKPPQWLHDSQHTPDWIQRHREVAAADSQFCANCHTEDYCTNCHDGRVRPRSIHPADYISMHPVEARMATQRCTSCHQEQSFCLTCHMRLGITMSGPSGVKESGRFHPPKSTWSEVPVGPGHHAFEAERNLNACVSCHTERDCVACHGGAGIGGGFNPHNAGFMARCSTQFRRNPRPCLVCHEPGEATLAECR